MTNRLALLTCYFVFSFAQFALGQVAHFHHIWGLKEKGVPVDELVGCLNIKQEYNADVLNLDRALFGLAAQDVLPQYTQAWREKLYSDRWDEYSDDRKFRAFILGRAAIADRHYKRVLQRIDDVMAKQINESAIQMSLHADVSTEPLERTLLQNYLFHDWLELTPDQLRELEALVMNTYHELAEISMNPRTTSSQFKAILLPTTQATITVLTPSQREKLLMSVNRDLRRAFVEYWELPGELIFPDRE